MSRRPLVRASLRARGGSVPSLIGSLLEGRRPLIGQLVNICIHISGQGAARESERGRRYPDSERPARAEVR